MKSVQKVALSFLIAVVLASGFTVLAFSGLFDFVETRFYNQRITDSLLSELEDAAGTVEEFNRKYLRSFQSLLGQDYIKRSYLPNQSAEDITERRQRISFLESELRGFLFTRFVDPRGRIHYSTLESDIAERRDFAITYKRFEEAVSGGDVEGYLVRERGNEEIIIDEGSGTIIYSLPFFDTLDIYKGSALFYVSVRSLRGTLMEDNIILPGEELTVVGDKGLVINLPDNSGEQAITEILENWENPASYEDRMTVMESENGRRFVLLSTVTDNGVWIGNLVDSDRFTLNAYLRIILLVSFFIIVFILSFLILSFRQDRMIVISERIKRFQINFLREYVEKSESIDKDVWRRDLAAKKGLVSREIKRGIGNLKPGQEEDVDALIHRSWDEILNLVGSRVAENRAAGAGAENAIKLENLERALEKVLQSGSLVVRTAGTGAEAGQAVPRGAPAGAAGGSAGERTRAPAGTASPSAEQPSPDTEEVIEDIEAVEEIEAAEETGENIPAARESENLGTPVDVEDIEDIEEAEAIEEVEFVEEIEEAEEAVRRADTEQPAMRETAPGTPENAPHGEEEAEEVEEAELAEILPDTGEALQIEELDKTQDERIEELGEAEPIEYVEEEPEADMDADELLPVDEVSPEKAAEPAEQEEIEELEELDELEEIGEETETAQPESIEELQPAVFETAEEEGVSAPKASKPEELGDFEEPEPEEVEEIPEERPEQFEEPEEDVPDKPEEIEEAPQTEEEVRPEEIEEAEEYADTEVPAEVEPAEEEEDVENVEEIDEEYDEVEELVPLPDFHVMHKAEESLEELETMEVFDEREDMVLERVSGGYSFFGSYGDGLYSPSGKSNWKIEVKGEGEASELEEIEEIEEIEEAEELSSGGDSGGLSALIDKGLVEVESIDDILGKLDPVNKTVEVQGGVFTIAEKVFDTPGGEVKDRDLKNLADDVLGDQSEEPVRPTESREGGSEEQEGLSLPDDSSIGELFSYSDVELPVEFGELVDEEETGGDEVYHREFCFQAEGFNLDSFIRHQTLSKKSGPMKSLLYLSRHFGALFGAVLVPKGNVMLPELTIGLDSESISTLHLDSDGELTHLVLADRNISLVKTSRIDNPEYKPAVTENDRRYLSSTFLIPGVFDEKPMILLLGLKSGTQGIERLVDQLIELC